MDLNKLTKDDKDELKYILEEFLDHFRIYAERYVMEGLKKIDKDDYLKNCQSAFYNMLESYHKFYDKCKGLKLNIEWFKDKSLLTIIELRNCMHHHKLWLRDIIMKNDNFKNYYVVDYYNYEAIGIKIHIKWNDFKEYLCNLKKNKNKSKRKNADLILDYLNCNKFERVANELDKNIDELYMNVLPLILNAGKTLLDIFKSILNEKEISKYFIVKLFEDKIINTDNFIFELCIYYEDIFLEEFYFRKLDLTKLYLIYGFSQEYGYYECGIHRVYDHLPKFEFSNIKIEPNGSRSLVFEEAYILECKRKISFISLKRRKS